jgi:uncharacterized OB-fold protein
VDSRPFNDASYEQYLCEGLLMASQCVRCGMLSFPPRHICAQCHASENRWVELRGTGSLAAFTSIFVAPPKMVGQGFDRDHPYVVGVVELDEGVRAVARIVGVEAKKPEGIIVGTRLQVVFPDARDSGERACLFFRPS